MKRLVIIAALLAAAGCATPPADRVHVVWTDDPAASCGGEALIGHIQGCTRRDGDTAIIYARRPRSENDTARFVTLGHELMHATEGEWHDRWGRMIPGQQARR